MLRRYVIFISLLSAYLLLLGHDIVPHHHHADHPDAFAHREHDRNHDDHDHDADEPEDHHHSLPDFFAHFAHAPYHSTRSDVTIQAPVKEKVKCAAAATVVFWICDTPEILYSDHPPDDHPVSPPCYSSVPLRAPPVC